MRSSRGCQKRAEELQEQNWPSAWRVKYRLSEEQVPWSQDGRSEMAVAKILHPQHLGSDIFSIKQAIGLRVINLLPEEGKS